METALEEPLNQRFVLLSESDIPLYPPAVVWLQLTSERKSRIHSCGDHFVSFLCPAFLLCLSHLLLGLFSIWYSRESY